MRVVTWSLPCWPNSGHSLVTGSSMSSLPRLARTWAQIAVAPLVQEKTMPTVSFFHGALVLGSAMPPHRSTTFSPRTVSATEAPTSPRSPKLRSKASATRSKPRAAVPSIFTGGHPSSVGTLGHRQVGALEQEARSVAQARLVDAVADTLGDVHAGLHAVLAQHLRRALGQVMRQHLVV